MNSSLFQIYLCRASGFADQLEQALFAETRLLQAEVLVSSVPLPIKTFPLGQYQRIQEMESWGKLWDSGYFRLHGEIPKEWANGAIWLQLEMGGEVLLFDSNCRPLGSLTNTCTQVKNFKKTLFPLFDQTTGGEKFTLRAEVAANGFAETADCEIGICRHLKYGIFRKDVWDLLNDFRAVLSLLEIHQKPPWVCPGIYHWDRTAVQGPADHRAAWLCRILNAAIDAYADNPNHAILSRNVLRPALETPAQQEKLTTTAVGHAHLDIGYLWKIAETKRKACRTFAGQLYNIHRYPGYVFGASQPQLYAFVKERMPQLYEQIKEAVKQGSWELQGGMWVEADCNLISGESMVRQFLHGKNFYKDEFGVDVKNLWLPDVFGYSAALPQIMQQAGCEFFLAQKLSWNEFNCFPYHSFRWRGIGNAEVMVHFLPEDNYNSYLDPASLHFAENNFQENHQLSEFLTLFGAGDGGGGPKMEHIETGRREANLEDVPHLKFGRAADFFTRMKSNYAQLPVWDGELYFELHRGTFTNQGRIKRWNRKLEQYLTAVEMLLALLPEKVWPRTELDKIWKELLMYQFHDILPGTSIHEVHAEVLENYPKLFERLTRLVREAIADHTASDTPSITFFQSLATPYRRLLRMPDAWRGHEVCTASGEVVPCQEDPNGLWIAQTLPPLSAVTLYCGVSCRNPVAVPGKQLILENKQIRCEFKSNGELIRFYDKTMSREMLTSCGGNRLQLYVDRARIFETWEVEITYRDIPAEPAYAIAEPEIGIGPLRSWIRFNLAIGHSKIIQTVVLENQSSRIDFVTAVDFAEQRRMLRVAFDTTVKTKEANCDIQHGFRQRPTHRNTSWELACFEFSAQRYVDLSDDIGGIALLNDCKYGYRVQEGELELNLLRSPVQIDPEADSGHHDFTYSLMPHAGILVTSDVMAEAAALNREPLELTGDRKIPAFPFILENDGVSVEAFKRAEKSFDHILRLVETRGQHFNLQLRLQPGVRIFVCDLLEWQPGTEVIPDVTGLITVNFTPFELKTLRLIDSML